jgi:hypothetical protein
MVVTRVHSAWDQDTEPSSIGRSTTLVSPRRLNLAWSDDRLSSPSTSNSTHRLNLERWALFDPDLIGHGADNILIHGLPRWQATEQLECYDRQKH